MDEIIRCGPGIGITSLSSRLAVPKTGDELERLASTLNRNAWPPRSILSPDYSVHCGCVARASNSDFPDAYECRDHSRKSRPEAEYRAALSQILGESEKLSLLVEQLLDLARADSGLTAFRLVRTNLAEAMDQAYRKVRVLADAKQLNASEHLPSEPIWIQGDLAALERLFLIFLDNAVKYTAPGGQIEMHLTAHDGVAGAEILDTGIGISPDAIPHIFERFYQADHSRSRENGGSGLDSQ